MFVVAIAVASELNAPRLAHSQENASKAEASPEPAALKQLIERINKLEAEVDRLKSVEPEDAKPADQHLFAMVDVAHLGVNYSNRGPSRFVALHVILANTTKQAFTISRDQVVATIDGEKLSVKDLPKTLQNHAIPSSNQPIQISAIKPPKEWKLPPEGQVGIWLVYADLLVGPQIPKCRLTLTVGDLVKEIDVNQVQFARLGLDIQKIGPRQCLALLTINGNLNSFNAGSLVDEVEKLVDQRISRVVLRWGDSASPPEPQISQWLQNSAAGNVGNANQVPMFPVFPNGVREFHLTEFPLGDESQRRNSSGHFDLQATPMPRVHKTAADSVSAALRTAYVALPKDELLLEIKNGHAFSRAAALVYGGGRLDAEYLPLIFAFAEDNDPEIQKAALNALCHFGEPQAIEKLVTYAKKNVEPISSTAVESLAASRFGAAHSALLVLLNNEPQAAKRKIVQILARHPRPVWSDALFEFVTTSPTRMDADSLRALIQVGHERIVDVLETALKSTDKSVRDLSFQELSRHSDQRSETIAINYALKLLETGPPDPFVVQLISRTKEPRAIPLLLKQMSTTNDRVNSISLLLQIGDQSVADQMVKAYSTLGTNDKVQILQGLKIFRHARFRELCGEALLSNENALVTMAATSLNQDGHPDGEKLLIHALERRKNSTSFRNICNALATYGTPTARAALINARDTSNGKQKNEINEALTMLSTRSPGYQFLFQAVNHQRNNQLKEALEAYDVSIQLDPQLAEAYLGRGKLHLKQEKFSLAKSDFEKVLELKFEPKDDEFTDFVWSYAIARIVDGDHTGGIAYLETAKTDALNRATDNNAKALFHYNSACAYSRAVEQVDNLVTLEDRDAIREKYRKHAIDDLTKSFQMGFEDYDWTEKDPDFKILRNDPDFKKILAGKPNDKSSGTPTPEGDK